MFYENCSKQNLLITANKNRKKVLEQKSIIKMLQEEHDRTKKKYYSCLCEKEIVTNHRNALAEEIRAINVDNSVKNMFLLIVMAVNIFLLVYLFTVHLF